MLTIGEYRQPAYQVVKLACLYVLLPMAGFVIFQICSVSFASTLAYSLRPNLNLMVGDMKALNLCQFTHGSNPSKLSFYLFEASIHKARLVDI